MPGKVKVKILSGRNLPVMDRGSDTTDAYVEIKFGTITHKTDVCRKSLNPQWNSDWYRFDVDDAELQDEPLQIRLMDHDTYSANDAIGKVNISLNPLLIPSGDPTGKIAHKGKGSVMSGWIPVFDTMHGIRGEVNVIVKVDLFSDVNKFRQSSCGVQFFHSSNIPHGYSAQIIHGFVEELVVNDDPEYQWIDKIRTPRASNEARQVVFLKLSGQVQRKIGLKAIDLGANAVIGYRQCFDLEGDVGVVARGIGTAVTLVKIPENPTQNLIDNTVVEERTLKYLEFLRNNSENPDSNSIFDSQNIESPNIVQNLFGIDTNLFEIDYFNNKIDETCGISSKEYEEEEKLIAQNRFRRKLSDLRTKMFAFPSKFSEAIKEKNLNQFRGKQSKETENNTEKSGLRMGALLIRSIMSTYISNNDKTSSSKDEPNPSTSEYQNKSLKSSNSSCSSGSESSLNRSSEILLIDVDDLHSIMRQLLAEGKIKENGDWILPESSTKELNKQNSIESATGTTKPGSSSSSDADKINLNILKRYLRENSQDDDGFEIWIKPQINVIDSEIEQQNAKSDTLFKSMRAKIVENMKYSQSSITKSEEKLTRKILHENNRLILKKYPKNKLKLKKSFSRKRSKRSKISRSFNKADSMQGCSENRKIVIPRVIVPTPPTPSPPIIVPSKSVQPPLLVPILKNTDKKKQDLTQQLQNSRPKQLKHHLSLPYNLSKLGSQKNDNFINNNNSNISFVTNLNANQLMPMHARTFQNFNRNESSSSPNKGSNQQIQQSHIRTESFGARMSQSPAKNIATVCSAMSNKDVNAMGIFRRSSDSDLSVTPKGNSLTSGERIGGIMRTGANLTHIKQPMNQENLDMLEYPFLTISKYPSDFILHLGATVAARSVKLLERVPNPDEPETRDSWWTELRMEIRSHARALGCNVVIGYSEVTTISDDVCVLSATGTAAVINFQYTGDHTISSLMTSSLDRQEFDYDLTKDGGVKDLKINGKSEVELDNIQGVSPQPQTGSLKESSGPHFPPNLAATKNIKTQNCTICHIPYIQSSLPFHVSMKKCSSCKRGKVPDVILATIEIPEQIQITGRGCLLQAQVCRSKRDLRSELNAKEISDGLPFLEYELHRLLINKLKVKGMNAIFGLKTTCAIGERMIALMATGTAVCLSSLPPANVPKIVAGNSWSDMDKLGDLQKALNDTFDRNRDIYQLKFHLNENETNGKYITSDTDDSDEDINEVDLNFGNKDTCILEVDDIEDVEIIASLMERCPPDGFHVVNTQTVPGLIDLEAVRNLQMFTQVWRAKFPINQCNINFAKHFQRILQSIYYKLRRMTPCAICDLKYRLDFPEPDEIQLLVTGMALGLGEPKIIKNKRKTLTGNKIDDELIFNLEEDVTNSNNNKNATTNVELIKNIPNFTSTTQPTHTQSLKLRNKSPNRNRLNSAKISSHLPVKDRYGVDITPLSYIPGGVIDKYLGNLNFFFIRESTSVRENGGISGFVHSFITEILAIVRSHVSALNGNAIIAFYMTELILVDNPHKNQGQCVISVGGDVVQVSYRNDD